MRFSLPKSIPFEEFDYNFLKSALRDYKNPRVKINDLLKKKDIIRVKKGLYVLGPEWSRQPFSRETLANLIYGPSYISLEYALGFYGMIPERVETITSVTNKRNKFFQTPVGAFSYRYLNPMLYPEGITLYAQDQQHSILIATPEKALADLLYFSAWDDDPPDLGSYLFQDLRLEKEALTRLNLTHIKRLTVLYGRKMSLVYEFLRNLK